MMKILFVCLGNICRSPMAEFLMKDLVKNASLSEQFLIESAGTSRAGGPVYLPAQRKLAEQGISCKGKTSRQLQKGDYDVYDLLIGMDYGNLRSMNRICEGDLKGKLHLLLNYTAHPRDIADPWYTDDFETAWNGIEKGCRGLLETLKNKRNNGC